MLNLPTFTTAATEELCREIAQKSKGTCFLMMSRGKDSLCAWLQLRRHFQRVIPFHCASVPHYRYVEEYLEYLECEFDTKVLRLMGEDLPMALVRHIYQESPWECDAIDSDFGPVSDFSKLDVLEYLRYKFNLPRAWCAVGISQNDSIDRLIYCRKNGGKNLSNKTFYPCFDWPREELLNAIWDSGLYVAPEYKYAKRSMGGVPSATYNKVMMEHFPKDWELTKFWYPLAEVKNVREQMIDENYPKWMEQEAAKMRERSEAAKAAHPSGLPTDGGEADEAAEDEVLPTCDMPAGEEVADVADEVADGDSVDFEGVDSDVCPDVDGSDSDSEGDSDSEAEGDSSVDGDSDVDGDVPGGRVFDADYDGNALPLFEAAGLEGEGR